MDKRLDIHVCSLLHSRFKLDYGNKDDVVDIKSRQRSSAAVATTEKCSQQTATEPSMAVK